MVILSSGQSGHLVIWSSGDLVVYNIVKDCTILLEHWNNLHPCESCFGDLIEQSGYLVAIWFKNFDGNNILLAGDQKIKEVKATGKQGAA